MSCKQSHTNTHKHARTHTYTHTHTHKHTHTHASSSNWTYEGEGWGLALRPDKKMVYMSDGSAYIRRLKPGTMEETADRLHVCLAVRDA